MRTFFSSGLLLCLSLTATAQVVGEPTGTCTQTLQHAQIEVERNAELALRGSEAAIALAQLEGNDRCQVEGLILRARAQRYRGNLGAAAATLREAVLRAREQHLDDLRALAQARLGQALETEGDLDQAMALITEAVQGAEQYPSIKAHALNLLGHVYQVAQRYQEAEQNYQQSLDLYRELGETDRTASVLLNLAVTALAMEKQGESENLSRLALKQFELNHDPRGTASTLHNLGSIHTQRGDLDLAMDAHREALVQRERLRDGLGTAISRTSLAEVLLARAERSTDPAMAQRLRGEAIALLELAADYKREQQTRPSLMATVRLLADAYAASGDHASAYTRIQEVVKLQRQAFSEETNRRFAEFSQRFELDRKARELEHAQLAQQAAETEAQSRTRLLLVVALAALLTGGTLLGTALLRRARRRAQRSTRQLHVAERMLIAAIGNAPAGILVVNREDLILNINRAALLVFGLEQTSPEDWVGRPANDIRDRLAFTDLEGRPIERNQMPLARVFREGCPTEQRELVVLDGREGRRVLITGAPVFDTGQQLTAAVLALMDITELRMVESQQDQLRARLSAAERSEAIHLALGGLAHEFSNQLSVAIGYAELLHNGEDEVALELRHALSRSNDLVRQLQLLAGYALPRSSLVRPGELAQQVVEAFAIAQPGAGLELHCEPDLPTIQGDAKLLRQALCELLDNAVESGPIGQRIRLRVALCENPAKVPGVQVQRANPAPAYIIFTVSDEGSGMTEQTRKRAFDPYFSGRPGGRGMGLPLVAGILRAHNSGLYLDTCPQAGTRVSVLLPVLQERSGDRRKPALPNHIRVS